MILPDRLLDSTATSATETGNDGVPGRAGNVMEERKAERELKRLNRSLHLLSACRMALFQAESEQQLLDEICQLVVGIGGYRMCWVGYAQDDAEQTVLPVADCGLASDYLAEVRISWADNTLGQGSTGIAIRTGLRAVNRNFLTNPAMVPWRAAALEHGYQSSVALPLRLNGRVFGALNIYAAEPDVFNEQELELLQEVADTLAFGIGSIRTRAEQRKAEEQLVLLSAAINEVRDAVLLVDSEGRFRYVNDQAAHSLGYSRDELVGMRVPDVDDDWPLERFCQTFSNPPPGGRETIETWLRSKGGQRFPVEIDLSYFSYQDERYKLALVRDISERKRMEAERQVAETARRESDQRFERAFEHAAIGKALLSPDGRWLRANRVVCEMLGYSEAELQQTTYQALTHPEDLVRGSEDARRVIAGELLRMQIEKRYLRCDGSYIWARLTTTMVCADNGDPLYFISQIENIDEHRRLQQRLNQADFALSRVREGIFLTDDSGKLRYVNEEACRALGYPREELMEMSLQDIDPGFSDEDGRKRLLAARETVRSQGTVLFESRHRNKDGREFPVEILGNAFEDDGEFLVLSLVRDISERKRLEAEREESEQRYREIFDNTLDSLFLLEVTPEQRFRNLAVNPAFERTVGIPREALIGKLIEEVVPPEPAEASNAKYRRCVAAGTTIDEEVELDLPVGRRHFHSTLVPVRDASGRVHRIVGITRDITERKQAEAIMHAREQEFRAFAENSPDAIVRYDTRCRRLYLNPVALACSGMSLGEALGRTPVDSPHGNSNGAHRLEAYLRQVIASGEPACGDLPWIAADGRKLHYDIRVVPEFDRHGSLTSVLSIARDILALKEAEQSLQESHDLLRELSARRETAREEERKHIAREIHDELGQILTALRMDVSMLRLKFAKDNPALKDDVQVVVRTVDKTIQVVRDVATKLRPAALDMGVAPAIEWLVAEFGRHRSIVCRLNIHDSETVLDDLHATVVFRIVQESLTNIARHAEATQVDITLGSDGSHYWVKVRDNGKGFKPARGGKASFGLIGMRERALMLGGAVHITSEPGLGTEICVCIPIQKPTPRLP